MAEVFWGHFTDTIIFKMLSLEELGEKTILNHSSQNLKMSSYIKRYG